MSKGFIIFLIVLLILGVGFWLVKDYFFQMQEGRVEFGKIQKYNQEIGTTTIYKNQKLGFSLNFPERWKNFKAEEGENSIAFSLESKNLGYHKVFAVSKFSLEQWNQIQKEIIKPFIPISGTQTKDSIFVYSLGQDDEGYVGFPEMVSNQIYKGPYYDVQNLIIPTFYKE